jgi:putative transposase
VRYAWIDSQCDSDPLQALCEMLGVSTSGYADWRKCGRPTHWLSDEQLLALIRAVHAQYRQAYGSPRITDELKSRGIPVSLDRVKRLMKENSIRVKYKRRYKATTDSKHAQQCCITPIAAASIAATNQPLQTRAYQHG